MVSDNLLISATDYEGKTNNEGNLWLTEQELSGLRLVNSFKSLRREGNTKK